MAWTTERARVAALSRSREPDDPDLVNARRDLRVAILDQHIQKVLASRPAPTEEQLQHLAAQFGGAQ